MKIDKEWIESQIWTYTKLEGQPFYTLKKVSEKVSVYTSCVRDIYFETETLEQIGYIEQSDVRCSWKRYYNASFIYGWDGANKTRKEMVKKLCTRADYSTARAMLLEEYKKHTK